MDATVGEAGWKGADFKDDTRGKMHVFFHTVQKKNNFLTAQEKRPVFTPKIHIKKLVPGDSSLEIDRPMRETDMEEFPVEWARFEQKKSVQASGTPIDAWPALNDTQKAEFRAMNIFTVDQMANLNESVGNKIMGFHDLKKKAQAFVGANRIDEAAEAAKAELEAKLHAQDSEIAELRAMVKAMADKKPARKYKARRKTSAKRTPKATETQEAAQA